MTVEASGGGRTESAISASSIRKTYRAQGKRPAKDALKGIDLEIPAGSIFGLLGPNGAGKSTFINILAGLVLKTSGRVEIAGHDIDREPRRARSAIGVVPQELNIDPFFTPFESLELQAGLYGVRKNGRHSLAILRLLGLEEQAHAYARTLSGGMRRRLLVAKAMVHAPQILVLDEPTAGVDVELRKQLWSLIRRLNGRGTTIVLTTHYLEEAQELCDRIAIINKGLLVTEAPTADLLARMDKKILVIAPGKALSALPLGLVHLGAELRADGRIAIAYEPSRRSAAEILARLAAEGIEARDISTVEPRLEDVFVELTAESA